MYKIKSNLKKMTRTWWLALLFFIQFVTASLTTEPVLSASNPVELSYSHFSMLDSKQSNVFSLYSLDSSASLSYASRSFHDPSYAFSFVSHDVFSGHVSHHVLPSSTVSASYHSDNHVSSHGFSIVPASFQLSFTYVSSTPAPPETTLIVLRLQFLIADETVATFTISKQTVFIAVLAELVYLAPSAVNITTLRDVARPDMRRLVADTSLDVIVDVKLAPSYTTTLVQLCTDGAFTHALANAGMTLTLSFVGYTVFEDPSSVPYPLLPSVPSDDDDELVTVEDSKGSFSHSPAFVVVVTVPSFFGFTVIAFVIHRLRKTRGHQLPFINVVAPTPRS